MGRPRKSDLESGTGDIKQEGKGQLSKMIDLSDTKSRKGKMGAGFSVEGSGGVFDRSEGRIFYKLPIRPTIFSNRYEALDIDSTIEDIRQSIMFYHNDSLVGRAIELMVTLANDGFQNITRDIKVKEWYDDWGLKIGIEEVLQWIFTEYFRSSNVVIGRTMIDYKADDGRQTTKKGKIPGAYTIINPLLVRPGEPIGFNKWGLLFIMKNKDMVEKMLTDKDATGEISELLDMNSVDKEGYVKMNPDNVDRILRLTQPYEKIGRPMVRRALPDLYLKSRIKEMDLSTVNGVINQLIKVTIGNDEHPASVNQLKRLARIFQEPSSNMTIVYNHTLKIEVVKVGEPGWLDEKKYHAVNDSIRSAFGISEILTGMSGRGGSGPASFLSVKGFMGNIIDARKAVSRWLYEQYVDIGKELNFKEVPRPAFNALSLADEIRERQIIATLVDKGIISYRSAQQNLGYDPDVEIARKREEVPLIEEGIYKVPGATGVSGDTIGGRPVGAGGPYPNRSPNGQNRLKGKGEEDDILFSVTGQELQSHGIQNKEQLMNFLKEKTLEEVQDLQDKMI